MKIKHLTLPKIDLQLLRGQTHEFFAPSLVFFTAALYISKMRTLIKLQNREHRRPGKHILYKVLLLFPDL